MLKIMTHSPKKMNSYGITMLQEIENYFLCKIPVWNQFKIKWLLFSDQNTKKKKKYTFKKCILLKTKTASSVKKIRVVCLYWFFHWTLILCVCHQSNVYHKPELFKILHTFHLFLNSYRKCFSMLVEIFLNLKMNK